MYIGSFWFKLNDIVDTGLRNVVSFRFSKDLGWLVENVVYQGLKRREKEVYYWKNAKQQEVDFLIKQGTKIKELIQVCWDIENFDVKKREINSLVSAMNEFKLKKQFNYYRR